MAEEIETREKTLYEEKENKEHDSRLAKLEWLREWKKHPLSYRFAHTPTGKPDVGGIISLFLILILMGGFYAFVYSPTTELGHVNYHLQNGIDYNCPGNDWHGNTSQMISLAGYNAVYYYCPMDGQLIGIRYYSNPIPI